jgi:hypothetical protein
MCWSIKLSVQRIRHSFQVSILSGFFSLFQERHVYSGKGERCFESGFPRRNFAERRRRGKPAWVYPQHSLPEPLRLHGQCLCGGRPILRVLLVAVCLWFHRQLHGTRSFFSYSKFLPDCIFFSPIQLGVAIAHLCCDLEKAFMRDPCLRKKISRSEFFFRIFAPMRRDLSHGLIGKMSFHVIEL